MTTTAFRLDIAPMPTPRPRARCIAVPGRKPIASFYSPKEYAEWQKEAQQALKKLSPDAIPPAPFDGPLLVSVVCEVVRPKTTKLAAPKPDVDNYAKGVLDVITKDGRFWADDTQVVHLISIKRWGETSGIFVEIAATNPKEL